MPEAAPAAVSGTDGAVQGSLAGGGEALYPWPASALRQQRSLRVHPGVEPGEADDAD